MPPLDDNLLNGLKLGLEGEHQYINAGLAIALCSTWLQRTGHSEVTYLGQAVSSTQLTFYSSCIIFTIVDFFVYLYEIEPSARGVHKRSNNSQFARTGSDCS